MIQYEGTSTSPQKRRDTRDLLQEHRTLLDELKQLEDKSDANMERITEITQRLNALMRSISERKP